MKHTIIHIDLASHHDIDVTEPPAPAFHSLTGRIDALLEQWAMLYDVEDWKVHVTYEERDI